MAIFTQLLTVFSQTNLELCFKKVLLEESGGEGGGGK